MNMSVVEWITFLSDLYNCMPIPVEKEEAFNFAVNVIEQTWRPRNELLHGHQIGDWTTFVDVVSKTADKYWKATMDRKMKSKKDYNAVSWKMPSQGTIKINFDAAFTEDLAIVALIARDHTSSVLGASTGSFAASDPFKAETLAH